MYSDNGTNFHGADRELRANLQAMRSDATLQANLANDGVQWHFIPLAAPHFGGLWEAGIKSFKFHLRRAIGSRTLSKAEFAMILCQIEAFKFETHRGAKRRSRRFIRIDTGSFFDRSASPFSTGRVSTGN